MCGRLAYMELAWIGDALLGPSTLLNAIIVLQCFRNFSVQGNFVWQLRLEGRNLSVQVQ